MAARTPEEIRASIEANRKDLGASLELLRGHVEELTDWRKQLAGKQTEAIIAAAAVGFVLGGGIAAVSGIVTLRRVRNRRKRRRW
ncbi:DUF3618 domain-containing protein [Conexibacter sp. JD483]|uniref:DUF3618 domain-containing protein n=1 Tax=unclassified Conexibacter TaxID=2627773 RepID=UPI002728E7FD|nr:MULTISPECIES: DUF3618 domain-containing protein [unclassified Conexibacter]MDO8186137.1 DUF3618 domain-containing protein [Conexibacter sp. CPCC 205706]MDO8199627.1 DUF3618 domain-containing protein [Conexibacter sp. CPCC 205762]MDR9369119.1 DUF3618 domain-containing protein [Conexibacter sp. JD483]